MISPTIFYQQTPTLCSTYSLLKLIIYLLNSYILIILQAMWNPFCPRKKQQDPEDDTSQNAPNTTVDASSITVAQCQGLPQEDQRQVLLRQQYGDLSMRGQFWKIDKTKYERGNWESILDKIQTIQARYLEINLASCSTKSISKQLSLIKFQNLIALYLHGNGITSIECFSTLYAPNLLDLDLRSNHISTIRSLRKCAFRLDHLFLNNNPLMELSGLSAVQFHKRIKRGFVSSYTYGTPAQTRLSLANMSDLAKMEGWYIFDHLQITPRTGLNSLQLSQIGSRYSYRLDKKAIEGQLLIEPDRP